MLFGPQEGCPGFSRHVDGRGVVADGESFREVRLPRQLFRAGYMLMQMCRPDAVTLTADPSRALGLNIDDFFAVWACFIAFCAYIRLKGTFTGLG